jgi:ABC-type branched-subunit amino acid transport system substrate-binding protein
MLLRFLHLLLVAALIAAAAPALAQKGTQIGAIVPESWPDKTRGEEIRNGMLLALKTWPGGPAPTLVVKDSACKPQNAQSAVQSLVEAKVDVVIGGFCVVGAVPKVLQAAGVPFVSANAERFATVSDNTVQLGSVPVNLADGIASKLRTETGLRVTAGSSCWIDYEARVPNGYDAVLCPTLHVDGARWDEIAPAYSAAYRKPLTTAAARGYAAMQVALAAIKQIRAGAKPGMALRDAKEVDTVLGKVRLRDDRPAAEDSMLLSFAPRLPRLSAKESGALDELMKTKGCGCTKGSNCPQSKTWSALPFVAQCNSSSPPGLVFVKR